ncbi:MAG TPA: pyridoxal-phosphate dependent enzyme, partial [bacterium]|nr:pyridoxal-phosphate dependent enzyme [bacterium]
MTTASRRANPPHIFESVTELVGHTPLIQLHLHNVPGVEIYAKMESFNPGGSVKDRPALRMIQEGIKSGKLTKDKCILDSTSGNTGI